VKKLLPGNLRNVSGLVILATLVLWGGYDLIPALGGPDGSTLSEVIQDHAVPPVILAAGYLLGHFWPTKQVLQRLWSALEKDDDDAPGT